MFQPGGEAEGVGGIIPVYAASSIWGLAPVSDLRETWALRLTSFLPQPFAAGILCGAVPGEGEQPH